MLHPETLGYVHRRSGWWAVGPGPRRGRVDGRFLEQISPETPDSSRGRVGFLVQINRSAGTHQIKTPNLNTPGVCIL